MVSKRKTREDINRVRSGTSFQLAKEFKIPHAVLKEELSSTAAFLQNAEDFVTPANQKALKGLATSLSLVSKRLQNTEIQERLICSLTKREIRATMTVDACYGVRCQAQTYINEAFENLGGLISCIKDAERCSSGGGRPKRRGLTAAAMHLTIFWVDELGRPVAIPSRAKANDLDQAPPYFRFLHACLKEIGLNETGTTCRNVVVTLQNIFGKELKDIHDQIAAGKSID